jgi:hypothetical protein
MGGAVVAVVAVVAEFGKDSSLNNIPSLFSRGGGMRQDETCMHHALIYKS